jgi:isopenicillin-N epimerase
MIGSMAVIPLPTNGIVQSAVDWADLQFTLFRQFRIEVPVIPWQPYAGVVRRLIRISAQLYNTQADYEVLTTALVELLAAEHKA